MSLCGKRVVAKIEPAAMTPSSHRDTNREFWWAILRLLFGVAQIAGATASVLLLLSSGVNKVTVITVAVTGVITVLSRILFSPRKTQPGK
jgi:uncharacterized membrane protein YhaH (DUF805 family)